MNVQTAVLLAVVLVLMFFAGKRVYKTFSLKGGGCACHGGGESSSSRCSRTAKLRAKGAEGERDEIDESRYPFKQTFSVGGMTCAHCAKSVESALGGVEGVRAQVDLESAEARVFSTHPIDEDALESAVAAAGYSLRKVR